MEADHQLRVVEGIIAAAYSGRKDIYTLPGLAGEVDDHGCNRISQKIQSILKAFAQTYGLDPKVVEQLKKGPIGGDSGAATAGKKGSGGAAGKGQNKRKGATVKAEDDDAADSGAGSPAKRARGKGKAAKVKEEKEEEGALLGLGNIEEEAAKAEPVD
jgi:hypothetical protein